MSDDPGLASNDEPATHDEGVDSFDNRRDAALFSPSFLDLQNQQPRLCSDPRGLEDKEYGGESGSGRQQRGAAGDDRLTTALTSKSPHLSAARDTQPLMSNSGTWNSVKSIDFHALLEATIDKAVDIATGSVVEELAKRLTGVAEGPAFFISNAIDLLTPVPTREYEGLSDEQRRAMLSHPSLGLGLIF